MPVAEAITVDALSGAAELLKALASPVRLAVVAELSVEPRCVSELQQALGESGRPVSQPLLSQHLKVLRSAGLVASTKRGAEVTYRLVGPHVGHIVNDAVRHSAEEQR